MAYKSGNPALGNDTFKGLADGTAAMTLEGTANKSLILLALAVITSIISWKTIAVNPGLGGAMVLGGLITGLILALIVIFKKKTAPVLAPAYALVEGLVLGGVSQLYESAYGGIVMQAILLTGGIFLSMLLLYRSRIIKATENFKLGVAAATGGIFIFYLVAFIGSFFGFNMPLINDSGTFGILFSLFVVAIAALNLVVDFDFIESGVEANAPKYMEWYASFGLFVTLIWLYLEILRLLAKSRD